MKRKGTRKERHYSEATLAKLRERGRELARKYGFKKGHKKGHRR